MDDLERRLKSLARRYANFRVPVEDLMQEGRVAAWLAEQSYDGRGLLRPRMYLRAKWAMLHYLRDKAQIVRLPAYLQARGVLPPICDSISEMLEQDELLFATRDFVPALIDAIDEMRQKR